jgi:Uma2 family endonuclease
MSTIRETSVLPDAPWLPSPLYRLTLDQYEAMVASGAFTAKDRFHLINGFLVAKTTQNDPHSTADELCGEALSRLIPAGWHVRASKPVRLPPDSKPEPDRCVVRGTIRDYSNRSPGSANVGSIVEVSDSSLLEDQKVALVYAASGIPVYWIVNLVERQVEVSADPSPVGYQSSRYYRVGQDVPVVLDGVEVGQIAVADLLL